MCCHKWQDFLLRLKTCLVCICHIFFIQSSVDRYLGDFHLLAIVNNDEYGNADIFLRSQFQFLCISSQKWDCWITWQFYFQFLKDSAYCFHSDRTNLRSHSQCIRVPFLHILANLLSLVFFFLINLFIYLFLFLAVLGLRCCARAFSNCGEWGQLFIAVRGLLIVVCGLQSAGSVVVVYGLSCSAACGIFPDQSSSPCSLHWQADS